MVLAVLTRASVMQAIEFVQMQRDDELWELLISLALSDADMTGASLCSPPFLDARSFFECFHLVPSSSHLCVSSWLGCRSPAGPHWGLCGPAAAGAEDSCGAADP